MTTELVLLLGIYAFILLGVFLGPLGPVETYKKSAPRLAAKVERNISLGWKFKNKTTGEAAIGWKDPE